MRTTATRNLIDATAGKDAAETRAERAEARKAAKADAAERPRNLAKLGNPEKRELRRAMADQIEALDLTTVRDRYPALAEFSDDVLMTQVKAYTKYLLPEVVKECSKQ